MTKKRGARKKKKNTLTGSIQNDAIFLIFGVIVGFVTPFLLWLIIINYFLTFLKY